MNHTQLTAPHKRIIYTPRTRKPRNYSKPPGVDYYTHAQILHYAMTKYWPRNGLKKFKKVGEATVEKELNQIHTKGTFIIMNVANMG